MFFLSYILASSLPQPYHTKGEMTDHHWAIEKKILLQLPLEEKRKQYQSQDFVTFWSVDPWRTFVVRNKNIKVQKPTIDDITEYRKFKFNSALDLAMSDKIAIYTGDITKLEVDAIVNRANYMLRAGGGLDEKIHRAAGPLLQEECDTCGGCPTGEARITGGYNLPAKYVIHTVGPQDGTATKLESCYKKCLSLYQQEDHRLNSFAFPCISTGKYGFPNRLAAHIALRTARIFLETHQHILRIIFCVHKEIDMNIYLTLLHMYFPVQEWNYGVEAKVTTYIDR